MVNGAETVGLMGLVSLSQAHLVCRTLIVMYVRTCKNE